MNEGLAVDRPVRRKADGSVMMVVAVEGDALVCRFVGDDGEFEHGTFAADEVTPLSA